MSSLASTTVVTYPSIIARACAALDESPIFRTLPDGYFRVVVRIVKKINLARLKAPIVASRSTLAEESGKSVETVGRAIKWLEDRGLIERAQRAQPGLRGSSSPLVPTEALIHALLLKQPSKESVATPNASIPGYPQKEAASAVSGDASKSEIRKPQQSFRGQPETGAFVRIDELAIPHDLAWLITRQGLRASGVLALMKLAKMFRQRLSDVVAATRTYLEGLRGRNLFAYLRALVLKDRDYGRMAHQDREEHRAQQDHRRLEEKALALCGRKFRTKSGNIFVTVEKNGIVSEIRDGRHFAKPMDQAFLDALDEGRLVPIRTDV